MALDSQVQSYGAVIAAHGSVADLVVTQVRQ